jgi:hypothetical protein
MKKKAVVSLVLTSVLLIVGYASLESMVPTKMILAPGLWAEFELAPFVSPATIGIGGSVGVFVMLAVSGAFWFLAIFAGAIGSGHLFCHPRKGIR